MEGDTGKYTHKSEFVVPENTDATQKTSTPPSDAPQQKEEQHKETKEGPKPSQDEITDSALEKSSMTKIQMADASLVIANQPRRSSRKVADCSFHSPFNDAHSERDWATKLCLERTDRRSYIGQCCCWPAYRYGLAVRLGETPFMPLIPCAALALRIKIRSLFGIKGSLIKDFFTALCCEPCAVCQMTREMDEIGL